MAESVPAGTRPVTEGGEAIVEYRPRVERWMQHLQVPRLPYTLDSKSNTNPMFSAPDLLYLSVHFAVHLSRTGNPAERIARNALKQQPFHGIAGAVHETLRQVPGSRGTLGAGRREPAQLSQARARFDRVPESFGGARNCSAGPVQNHSASKTVAARSADQDRGVRDDVMLMRTDGNESPDEPFCRYVATRRVQEVHGADHISHGYASTR
eukprot:368612-Rhodomonas_salina.5